MAFRKLTTQENALLTKLVLLSSVPIAADWNERLLVREMQDGGMGSLSLFPEGKEPQSKVKFGAMVSSIEFFDIDAVKVIASLYTDNNGDLFELDVWKTDFSPMIKLPSVY